MAVVSVADAGHRPVGLGQAANVVLPDESAFDVLRAVRSCRGTGIGCIDGLLDGACLGPSELVVLHGESSSAKSTLIRNIIASYVASAEVGGHALPAVLIDTEGTFDVLLLTRLLAASAERRQTGRGIATSDLIHEALSRLLVLRPAEPADLLRQIYQLRNVLVANPTTSLLVVDSMSAWQPIAAAFPRAVAPVMREVWKALRRVQNEHCLAVIVAHREDAGAMGAASSFVPGGSTSTSSLASHCCHLSVARRQQGEASFATSKRCPGPMTGGACLQQEFPFVLSDAGEIIAVA